MWGVKAACAQLKVEGGGRSGGVLPAPYAPAGPPAPPRHQGHVDSTGAGTSSYPRLGHMWTHLLGLGLDDPLEKSLSLEPSGHLPSAVHPAVRLGLVRSGVLSVPRCPRNSGPGALLARCSC